MFRGVLHECAGDPTSTDSRYVLYDSNADQLITTQLFDTYAEAADVANQLRDILILPIVIPTADEDATEDDESAEQPCD